MLFIQELIKLFNKPKVYLVLGNFLLISFLIIFSNLGVIPFNGTNFIFVIFFTLAMALYRPGWAFLFFIGVLPLENINLAPLDWGVSIRPYQLLGILIILAVSIRFFSRRLNFPLIKLQTRDWAIIIILIASIFSAFLASDKIISLKLSLVLASFIGFYFLVRTYIQSTDDLKKIIPFVLSSGIIIIFYGLSQNIFYLYGFPHFEVMPGRPNSTFPEPDWLGGYLVLLLSLIYSLLYFRFGEKNFSSNNQIIQNLKLFFLFVYLVLIFILLIITVSRSAWLGALAVNFIYLFIVLTNLRFRNWQWKSFWWQGSLIFSAGLVGIAYILVFHLTDFQLFNRVKSTQTGLQKITIACPSNFLETSSLSIVRDIKELDQYNCRHINLEEIEEEKNKGNQVLEIEREDPNIKIRQGIYQKSWAELRARPFWGLGWGNISTILGNDERGVPLNSSNLFLETWLGSGLGGLFSLSFILGAIFFLAIKNYFLNAQKESSAIGLFFIVSWVAIVVPNLFNAGIFLGFFWVWLAISGLLKAK